MSHPSLDRQIKDLTLLLAEMETADAPTRDLLSTLQKEVSRVLDAEPEGLTERLEELAVRFEADHPAAGTALRQAIDALAKAGI